MYYMLYEESEDRILQAVNMKDKEMEVLITSFDQFIVYTCVEILTCTP